MVDRKNIYYKINGVEYNTIKEIADAHNVTRRVAEFWVKERKTKDNYMVRVLAKPVSICYEFSDKVLSKMG